MKNFLQWWGEFVAMHRVPARAARLRELEQMVKSTTDRAVLDAALDEIREITEGARRETLGGGSGAAHVVCGAARDQRVSGPAV